MKVALLGGSFNPIHYAHLALAQAALEIVDKVEFLPAKAPWQKPTMSTTPQQRLDMIKLAIADEPRFAINTCELERAGKTYTIDTLRDLCSANDAPEYYWIMGLDQLKNFKSWYNWQEILSYVKLLIASRQETLTHRIIEHILGSEYAHLCTILPFSLLPISSTDIRERIKNDASIAQLLPASVEHYIYQHHLYKT
ncbi:hypothetical protein IX83_04995 [Basilea psittacipulmonis DSM 24701]|uniref:Probable nicotinate-nucleotide adenylyltransferase n=2 Tax=Basilea TaxID=1472344 RepID=A0A077DI08_9BURK|nr:hypothetical protein IX83_04995 [Basilea psittacipulmonis DSM 24701]